MNRRRAPAATAGPAQLTRPAPHPWPGPRVVISSFDSPGNRHYAGGGSAVVELLAGWLAGDFQVLVVTAARRGGHGQRAGVRYRYLPVTWAGPRAGQLLFHLMLPLAARRIPHEVWIESFTPPFSTSFVPLFSAAPVVGLAQNLSGRAASHRYKLPFFLVERAGLRCYRDIVVLNPADRQTISEHNPQATVRVIPNSVDLPALGDLKYGAGEHILYLGRVQIRDKGLDLLLAAYQRSGAGLPLVIAGAGTPREEKRLAALVASAGDSVRWAGPVTGQAKDDLLRRSAFLVMPSRAEAFGLAALEGMAYGKPVVHFGLPTLDWMRGDVSVPPFDTGALATAIGELATDRRRRSELGRAARAAARQYSREAMAERYRALVRQLAGLPGEAGLVREGRT